MFVWALFFACDLLAQVSLFGRSTTTVARAGFALWAVQLALLLLMFPLTEKALSSAFTNDGQRR